MSISAFPFERAEPVTVRRVLLVPHTHHDVGYTASPRIVDDQHRAIVGEVLRLAAADRKSSGAGPVAGPGGAGLAGRFRWTFEVARPVLRFLSTATPAERADLQRLVAEG